MIDKFTNWYTDSYGLEPNFNDKHTFDMLLVWKAGYDTRVLEERTAQKQPSHSPIRVKQTPESAAEIGQKLRDKPSTIDLGEDGMPPYDPDEWHVTGP
jgi:hypothetical protein